MSIERKIRFKAIGLYIVAGVSVAVILFCIYELRNSINNQRENIEKQHLSFTLTNELIYAVGEAQSSISLYMSTTNALYLKRLDYELTSVDSLIDILSDIRSIEKDKLQEIRTLLIQQASNVYELNRLFSKENPVSSISERLQSYEPPQREEIKVISIKKDTIVNISEKKNFFQRIKEVFNPSPDSTAIVTNQRIDTLRFKSSDSLAILSEVDSITRKASETYEQNIRAIERQVASLITADREISTQISELLLELHRQTLDSVLKAIAKSEDSINRNYQLSIIGGTLALGLILLFIILIIYDVNKGKEAREKIRQLMDSRHQLLLSVSHDIKSPLGSILGYLELNQQQGEDIQSVQNSARHILALLENLLEFSSLEQGALHVNYADFSLDTVCNEIGQMFVPLAEAKRLSFIFETDRVKVNTDLIKIKQIVVNLVSNAIKYTSKGEVFLRMSYADEKILVQVQDTGVGIPEDKLPDLYKPFTRIESNNVLAYGSGLGMYVVKGLIDLLGGSINIKSEVGKGTIVDVVIPAKSSAYLYKKGTKKIAVYEDDDVMARVVRGMLLQLGHKIEEQDCDIILTDMEMGEVSGLDVLAAAGNVPVIVMTGRDDFSAEKAGELGFDGYLSKPFTIDNLRDIFGEGDSISDDDFLGEDRNAIMDVFRSSTIEYFSTLREALEDLDFDKTQAVCHKMLPMFAQLGYPVEELRRMDVHRKKEYAGWQADVESILSIKGDFKA